MYLNNKYLVYSEIRYMIAYLTKLIFGYEMMEVDY